MNKSEKVFCMCEFGDLLCRWKGSFLEFENLLFVDNNEKHEDFPRSLKNLKRFYIKIKDFTEQQVFLLLASRTYRFLAIQLNSSVCIITVPPQETILEKSTIVCSGVWIRLENKIINIAWHSLSAKDSHLLVLTNQSLYLYDVLTASADNMNQWTLFSYEKVSHLPKSAQSSPVKLDLPDAGPTFPSLSAYVFYTHGELYIFCPVLPRDHLLDIDFFINSQEAVLEQHRIIQYFEKLEGTALAQGPFFLNHAIGSFLTSAFVFNFSLPIMALGFANGEALLAILLPYQPMFLFENAYDDNNNVEFSSLVPIGSLPFHVDRCHLEHHAFYRDPLVSERFVILRVLKNTETRRFYSHFSAVFCPFLNKLVDFVCDEDSTFSLQNFLDKKKFS
jgi:hypothetical protein